MTPDLAATAAVCSVRYALGRSTYVVGDVAALVRALWPSLDPRTRSVVLRDLREAIERDDVARVGARASALFPLGMDCDRAVWLALYSDLEAPCP